MNELAQKKRLFPVWFLAAAVVFFGGAAAFFRTYVDWKHIPLVVLSAILMTAGFSFGLLLAADAGEKELSLKAKLITFISANVVSQIVLWVILSAVNVDGQYNRRAIYTAYFIFMPLFAVFAVVMLHRIPKLGVTFVNRFLGFVCVVGLLAAAFVPVVGDPNVFLIKCVSPGQPEFSYLTTEALSLNDEEKEDCRTWFSEHILLEGEKATPAFSMTVDGVHLRDIFPFFDIDRSDPVPTANGGETTTVTLTKSGLEIRVVGTLYEEYATCEWTVYVRNTDRSNSDVISDVLALDSVISSTSPKLFYSTGSNSQADDFTMKKAYLLPSVPLHFYPVGGRSSDGFLPYFNLCGKNGGVVAAIGWTGEWKNDVVKTDDGAQLSIGQKDFNAYLLPGEEIRTPRISLTFSHSANPVKGFNLFRSFVADCVMPSEMRQITSYVLADEFSTLTARELTEKAKSIPADKLAYFNNFWMDAGWYDYEESWWDGVGTWSANKQKFPNSLIEVGNTAKEMGKNYLLWFEPERVCENTELWKVGTAHENWLVSTGGDSWMWNLAEDGATEHLENYISSAIQENGVTVYRQDFNFEPLEYWQQADAEYYDGRTGIAENHYITHLYDYLDTLIEKNPGLLIDNCASGGRRLDLEMASRSVPLWRSDYNCDGNHADLLEATQAMTYGLSFWLPSYGTSYYTSDVYAARSSIMPCCSTGDAASEFIGAYETERGNMLKNYFPLTKGGVKADSVLAVQYGVAKEGHAVVYIREKYKDGECTICFSGLESDKQYIVENLDDPNDAKVYGGSQLMKVGITIPVTQTRTALIYHYRLK